MAGSRWQDSGLIFTTAFGTPPDGWNVTCHFHTLRDAAGLLWLRFYDLRHAYGSLLAAQGVHPRVAMELMGHSQSLPSRCRPIPMSRRSWRARRLRSMRFWAVRVERFDSGGCQTAKCGRKPPRARRHFR